jgi:hypothetical protein
MAKLDRLAAVGAGEQSDVAPSLDDSRVLIARWVLFAQGALIAIAAVGGFAAGYFFGRVIPNSPNGANHANAAVQIEGRVASGANNPTAAPDADSVVIALPMNAAPAERIGVDGLRPDDPTPAENNSQVRIIESLDGAYARVDEAGRFHFTAAPGNYLVLAISRHELRPPGDAPQPEDMVRLERFFSPAAALIGQAKYKIVEQRLSEHEPLEIDF